MRSDATKRVSRRANGSLRPKTNWLWKSPAQARRNGVRFGWVGADAGYGSGPDFLFSLADAGHTFLIDVHKSFVIYGVDPQPKPGPSTKGRTPNRSITEQHTLSVQQFVQGCPTKDWRVYNVRETTRGSLKLRVLRKSVYVWDKYSGKGRRYELLVTESLDGQDRKYSLTNQSHRHPHGACAGCRGSGIGWRGALKMARASAEWPTTS